MPPTTADAAPAHSRPRFIATVVEPVNTRPTANNINIVDILYRRKLLQFVSDMRTAMKATIAPILVPVRVAFCIVLNFNVNAEPVANPTALTAKTSENSNSEKPKTFCTMNGIDEI